MKKAVEFFKNETVLTVSAILAAASCFLVPPDGEYWGYINYDTLIVLFSLMVVVAGLRELGLFSRLAHSLLSGLHGQRGLTLTLVGLCFVGSMVITNDVALITFVPLALMVLELEGREDSMVITVTLMTVAANLGSILTPIGNPQNLYIYSVSGLTLWEFVLTMAPYAALSAALLAGCCFVLIKPQPVSVELEPEGKLKGTDLAFYLILFAVCIAAVAKLIPVWILLPLIVVEVGFKNWRLLLRADWGLLATFVCFFVFIGNMGRFPPFKNAVLSVLEGHVLGVSAALSQVISNVPAALLLGGFTDEWKELLVGVNIGGLGTLIASMASLISFKQLSQKAPERRGRYLLVFTAVNVLFLAALAVLSVIL